MTDMDFPWLTPEEQLLWRRWITVGSRINVALARQMQKDSGISLPDYEVLVNLSEAPENRMRVAALADALQWDRSRLSHQLSRMRNRELVTRESCDSDGRGAFIVLTDTGLATIKAAAPGHVSAVRALVVDRLTADQSRELSTILAALAEQFDLPRCEATENEDINTQS